MNHRQRVICAPVVDRSGYAIGTVGICHCKYPVSPLAVPRRLRQATRQDFRINFHDGVVIGSDTRSTAGDVVAAKNCEKLHKLAPNIYAGGAGTAADLGHVCDMIASSLSLHRYATGRDSRVVAATTLLKNHLFQYQGHVGCALVLGGVDVKGPQIFMISPYGSTDSLPYAAMGSGSVVAMSILEQEYRDNMSRDTAVDLITRAILSGVYNDLGSGSNVDVCVIGKDGQAEVLRNHQLLQGKLFHSKFPRQLPPGTTKVLKSKVLTLKDVDIIEGEPE